MSFQFADMVHEIAVKLMPINGFEGIAFEKPNKVIINVSNQKASRQVLKLVKPFTDNNSIVLEVNVNTKGL